MPCKLQRATCSMQHAACSMQHATCAMPIAFGWRASFDWNLNSISQKCPAACRMTASYPPSPSLFSPPWTPSHLPFAHRQFKQLAPIGSLCLSNGIWLPAPMSPVSKRVTCMWLYPTTPQPPLSLCAHSLSPSQSFTAAACDFHDWQ